DRIGNHPAAWANAPVPSPGEVRGAYRFNGTSYVAAQNSPAWHFGGNDFSLDLWANFAAAPGGSVGEPAAILIANDEGPFNRNKWFFAVGGGLLYFHINGPQLGPQFFPLVPFSPVVGHWYHLAVVRAGSLYTIYIDGVASGTATNPSVIPDPNAPLTMAEGESIGFMNGLLDEVAIYSRALQPEEVAAIFRAGPSGKCISLQVSPNVGGDTGKTSVTLTGARFQSGATASLVRAGEPGIAGNPVTVGSSGTTLATTFDLAGQPRGAWDVLVTNPDGTSVTLPQGFTVQAGTAPQVWVNVVGLGLTVPGRPQTLQLFYGNSGNVDALGVPLWVAGIPPDAAVQPGFSVVPPVPLVSGVDYSGIPAFTNTGSQLEGAFLLPAVTAGATGALQLTITVPALEDYQLEARTNKPWFDDSQFDSLAGCFSGMADLFHPPNDPSACIASQLATQRDLVTATVTVLGGGKPDLLGLSLSVLNTVNDCFISPLFCGACGAWDLEACVPCLGSLAFTWAPKIYSIYETSKECIGFAASFSQSTLPIHAVRSLDPNNKVGPPGFAQPGWIVGQQPLTYSVLFQNQPTASAPAQQVVITDQLDPTRLDLNTLSLGPISFAGHLLVPSPAATSFATDVDLRPAESLIARTSASLDPNSGLLTWRFISIDPATGNPPLDPEVGFLPADLNPPEGEGSVLFTVLPKAGTPTGTQVQNQAKIGFDTNVPLVTQIWLNTIDNDRPTSSVVPLAPTQALASFTLQWSGTDLGSGIRDYTLYVSDNGGAFTPLIAGSADTSTTFAGQPGHSYAFYTIARDGAGNIESPKTAPDTTTQVLADSTPPVTTATLSPAPNAAGWNSSDVTVTLTAADDETGGTGVRQIAYSAAGAQPAGTTILAGSSGSFTIATEGTTTITFFGTDNAGNVEAAKTVTVNLDKTPPAIAASRAPAPDAYGWNQGDVTVSFSCTDILSGLAPGSPPVPSVVSAEGANQSVTGSCMDRAGNLATLLVQGIDIDRTPPTVACSASPSVLWPPNHRLVPITVSVSVSDALSGPAGFTLQAVSSNEPDSGEGDIRGFVPGTASTTGQLRAERLGAGRDRVYTFTYVGTDRAGNSATCTTSVSVPHDQGH
ncbi:MAG TPA: LamG domain-containing protein, partial [Thermoanaerobaculia bacterium]|nr:LamG domain-containing protein [Thermoanaerobaculia bacterium]